MALELLQFKAIYQNLATIDAGFDKLNRGGLSELYLILPSSISVLPSYNLYEDATGQFNINATHITLLANSEVFRLRFLPDSAKYSETQKEDDNGILYEQILKLDLPKTRAEVTWLKHKVRRRRYVAIYRDNNGLVRILGTKERGFQFQFKEDISGENNFYEVTGKLNALAPAPFWSITGEITDNITIL